METRWWSPSKGLAARLPIAHATRVHGEPVQSPRSSPSDLIGGGVRPWRTPLRRAVRCHHAKLNRTVRTMPL